jgi:hypothetical protein
MVVTHENGTAGCQKIGQSKTRIILHGSSRLSAFGWLNENKTGTLMAKLLDQIRDQATDSSHPLGDVLRRMLVLAARLRDRELERWVRLELDGYPKETPLPEYRVIENPQAVGHFSGVGGSQAHNMPISSAALPDEFEFFFTHLDLRKPAATYEKLVRDAGDVGYLQVDWPAEILGHVNQFDMGCVGASWKVPVQHLAVLVEAVRNKVLGYVLDLERESPDAGEAIGEAPSKEVLQQVFNNNILGNVGNLAQGSSNVSQTATFGVKEGDLESLLSFLRGAGLSEALLADLKVAAEAEPPEPHRKKLGPRIRTWIGKMLLDLPPTIAADLIVRAILVWSGLPVS